MFYLKWSLIPDIWRFSQDLLLLWLKLFPAFTRERAHRWDRHCWVFQTQRGPQKSGSLGGNILQSLVQTSRKKKITLCRRGVLLVDRFLVQRSRVTPEFSLRETGSIFLKNTSLENFQVFFTGLISVGNKFKTINSFNYCRSPDATFGKDLQISSLIQTVWFCNYFFTIPVGCKLRVSQQTWLQIWSVPWINWSRNKHQKAWSFISAGAESQGEVILSLVRLTRNTFIFTL